jgi:hypothetical protein
VDRPLVGSAARSAPARVAILRRFVLFSVTIRIVPTDSTDHPPIPGDPRRQPPLPIERSEQLVDVDDRGLELDDREGATLGQIGEHIDHAALAIDRERHLRGDDPVRQVACEPVGHRFLQCRVGGVEQASEVSTSPAREEVDPDVQARRDALDRPEGDALKVAPLDPRHLDVGDAGSSAELSLGQSLTTTDRPDRRAEADRVHRDILAARPHRPVTCQIVVGRRCSQQTARIQVRSSWVDDQTRPEGACDRR